MRAIPEGMRRPEMDFSGQVKKRHEQNVEVYDFETLTPMFGGGATKREPDELRPVHGQSIRGHLREWWRLLFGSDDSEETFLREGKIWGTSRYPDEKDPRKTISKPSRVTLNVEIIRKEKPFYFSRKYVENGKTKIETFVCQELGGKKWPTYSLFPFQGTTQEGDDPKPGYPAGLAFKLSVIYSEKLPEKEREEVRMSLKAWANFGGVGSRTRRGLGALWCRNKGVAFADPNELRDFLINRLQCEHCMLGSPTIGGGMAAWDKAVGMMKAFRQDGNLGRNPGKSDNHPGRSRWPEPDRIRAVTHRAKDREEDAITNIDGFPRARLGLPIIFQYGKQNIDAGEPENTTLTPKGATRMSSPVILRPLKFADGSVRPMALFMIPQEFEGLELDLGKNLRSTSDGKIKVKTEDGVLKAVIDGNAIISQAELDDERDDSPLRLYGSGDAVTAFWKYLNDKGWRSCLDD